MFILFYHQIWQVNLHCMAGWPKPERSFRIAESHDQQPFIPKLIDSFEEIIAYYSISSCSNCVCGGAMTIRQCSAT